MRLWRKSKSDVEPSSAGRHFEVTNGRVRSRNPTAGGAETESIVASAGAYVIEGRLADALALVTGALAAEPRNGRLRFAKASILFSWGRYQEACAEHDAAEACDLRTAALLTQHGWALYWTGRVDEAESSMRQAVLVEPGDWAAQFGLGSILHALKRDEEALACSLRAVELNPDDFYCIANVVACEIELGHHESAEVHARRGIDVAPTSAMAWSNLGGVLEHRDRHDEARAAYRRALELEDDSSENGDEYLNHVIALINEGSPREAIAILEARLPSNPDARAQSHYALALLTVGRFAEGWRQYEFRWMKPPLSEWRPRFVKPLWTGQPLRGRTILLRTEQGHGDFIQFIRYAPFVKALGARVLLELREEMRELARSVAGIDEILRPGEPYPPFDLYAHLMSLPLAFGTDAASTPARVPYLSVAAEHSDKWARRVERDGMLNVGLVWAGLPDHPRDRQRSLSLVRLAPLARIEGVRFHLLQKGAGAAEALQPPAGMVCVDHGPQLLDYTDTAAVIEQLDLVIGVDTSVVHLAGALGKPVWVMVSKPSDWRWLEEREDTPWYPTMRLFRQREANDWDDVIRRVGEALGARVREHAARNPAEPRAPGIGIAAPDVGATHRSFSEVAQTRAGLVQHFPDSSIVERALAWYGEHRQLEIDIITRLGVAGATILEAGSGMGHHSLLLSKAIGVTGHLWLYEGDDLLKKLLHQNLASNQVTNATLMRRVLPGCARPLRDLGATKPGEVETVDELQLPKLDWLKCNEAVDAERVLEGAVETLWRCRPRLFLSVPDEPSLHRLHVRARDLGYRCWSVNTPLFNPSNFNLQPVNRLGDERALAMLALPEEISIDIGFDACERLA